MNPRLTSSLDGERLLQIARDTGLRHHLHAVEPSAARDLLTRFAEAVIRVSAPAAAVPVADCWSNNDGDSWRDNPDDCDFLEGLKVGDEYELQASIRSWPERFRVTRVPDAGGDEYEVVQLVSPTPVGAPAEPNELEAGVTAIVTLMENGEWADILGSNPLLPRLWDAINDLYEKLDAAQGTPAAAVADAQPIDWPAVEKVIDEYIDDYEMVGEDATGREGYYTPTDGERALIKDAVHGLLAEDEVMRHLRGAHPAATQSSGNPGPLAAVEPTGAAAEYNEWIRYHAAGNGSFDDFLQMVNERTAIAASKEGASKGGANG